MKREQKKKSNHKLLVRELKTVRKEIQTICKEIGWIQFSSFEELADMLCLPNDDYIFQSVQKLIRDGELWLRVYKRDMFITYVFDIPF